MLRNKVLPVLCPLLAMLATPAFALDIDRIEVKSRYGQPLLAEIPVIADDPAELQHLQARLASPATFARIGLERPRGVLKDLRFRLVRDARGKPVIRITSRLPVEQPFLTFLVQVEWGDGRLVREYSVSLDDPGALAAAALPLVEAPVAAPSNAIVRNPAPVPVPLAIPLAAPASAPPAVSTQPAPPAQAVAPVEVDVATRAAPAQREASTAAPATPAPPAPAPASAERKPAAQSAKSPAAAAAREAAAYGPVKAGDTLSEIAGRFVDREHSLNQVMLAFLRVNPEAFVAGNINLIRRGAVLQAPSSAELSRYGAAQAATMVREQIDHWREGIPATPQPVAPVIAPAPVPRADPVAVRENGPRLRIAPPSSDAGVQQAIRTGLQAAGIGDVLRPDPSSPIPDADARDAQLRELQARVAELEKLQQRQQRLIALKDSELAARPTGHAASWPWWLAALVVLPLSAWWWTRRRERVRSSREQPEDAFRSSSSPDDDAGPPATLHAPSPAWHSAARDPIPEPDR